MQGVRVGFIGMTPEGTKEIVTRDTAKDEAQTQFVAHYRNALGPIAGAVAGDLWR